MAKKKAKKLTKEEKQKILIASLKMENENLRKEVERLKSLWESTVEFKLRSTQDAFEDLQVDYEDAISHRDLVIEDLEYQIDSMKEEHGQEVEALTEEINDLRSDLRL